MSKLTPGNDASGGGRGGGEEGECRYSLGPWDPFFDMILTCCSFSVVKIPSSLSDSCEN
jgi:hypothetical protein